MVCGSLETKCILLISPLEISGLHGSEVHMFTINPNSMNGQTNAQNSKLTDRDTNNVWQNILKQENLVQCEELLYI